MRIVILLILLLSISSCTTQEPNIKGLWYNKKFGFLNITENKISHIKIGCMHPIPWQYDGIKKSYTSTDLFLSSCQMRHKVDSARITILKLNDDKIAIESDNECFRDVYGDNSIVFSPFNTISRKIGLNSLRVRAQILDEQKYIALDTAELYSIVLKENIFSMDDQLWMIFESGADYHNENDYSPLKMVVDYKVKNEYHFYGNSKTINTLTPCYLRPLLDHICQRLGADTILKGYE